MGKKSKTGKARRDKYYQLAKETGYRARSAFKLLQLNTKFKFLDSSRICVDLCAAPGGWLQVAQQNMPMSSIIIGVDLVPIKPIRNVITLQEDITTDKCRAAIRKEIKTWQVDVVLHDGAPNVGTNWIHDAFLQAQLTLQALKLAIGVLRKGGWFVTKVFRSADYNSLLWVFRQLFKKVYATKPKASRNESAEIFVVCQHYLSPDKIDPKFTDSNFVFKEIAKETGTQLNLMHPEKRIKNSDGYADGDYTLYHRLGVLDFLASSNHLDKLAGASEIVLDDPRIASHPLTTREIKDCCADIKVLGKREIRLLLNWRKKLNNLIKSKTGRKASSCVLSDDEESDGEKADDEEAKMSEEEEKDEDNDQAEEELEIDQQLKELQDAEAKEAKKKLKKTRQEKAKLQKKLELKMILPGDQIDMGGDVDLFNLKSIPDRQQLAAVEEIDLDEIDEVLSDADDAEVEKRRSAIYDRHQNHDYGLSSGDENGEERDEDELSEGWNDENEEHASRKELEKKPVNTNPRLVNLEDEATKSRRNASLWFRKETFGLLNDDEDEDVEIGQTVKRYKDKGGIIIEKEPKKKEKKDKKTPKQEKNEKTDENGDFLKERAVKSQVETVKDHIDSDVSDSSDFYSSDSDSESENDDVDKEEVELEKEKQEVTTNTEFEVVPANHPLKKRRLDAEGLAIGAAMAQSRRRRREVMETSYNRYTFDDQSLSLPDWFTQDETKHYFAQLPVTKEEVAEYRKREVGIDARPIKKIAEAKARKKRKMTKRLEKARKKADKINDDANVTDKEKTQLIKNVYKKAGLLKKKKPEIEYVVAKKGVGKRVSRPAGVKGRFKMVDPRMKKEVRKKKQIENNKRGKGKRRR